MIRILAVVLAMAASSLPSSADTRLLSFSQLDGWENGDHDAARTVFAETCDLIRKPGWESVCALARSAQEGSGRAFFEMLFRPVLIGVGQTALFTGYYEPELDGSRQRTGPYRYPLYRKPPEVRRGQQWSSRAEIESRGLLAGRGLEIAWVDDPVEKFFLQIQGSGRVRLPDGTYIRVGYGGRNGHPYRSVGQEMVRRGIYKAHQVSAQVIKNWVRRNPQEGRRLLWHNPSYIFFREVNEVPADRGPLGALNRSITAGKSIAIDPSIVPLGAPVWIEKDGPNPIRELMVAQDTGGAIKGAQRADLFIGTGDEAGRTAGRIKDPGRMVVLMPIDLAFARAPQS